MEEPTTILEVSHAEESPWLIAERQPHPIARHVRYVQAGTRIPIDVDRTARLTDLTRAEQPLQAHEVSYQQPYHETEASGHSNLLDQPRPIEVSCILETA